MTDTRLQQRYGKARRPDHHTGRRPRQLTIIITAIALVICVGVVGWASFRPKNSPQTPKDVAYKEIDATRMAVTISAVPDKTRTTRCAVQAVSLEEAVVGYKEVDYPADANPDHARPIQKHVMLNTTQQAVSGQLDKCWFVLD